MYPRYMVSLRGWYLLLHLHAKPFDVFDMAPHERSLFRCLSPRNGNEHCVTFSRLFGHLCVLTRRWEPNQFHTSKGNGFTTRLRIA